MISPKEYKEDFLTRFTYHSNALLPYRTQSSSSFMTQLANRMKLSGLYAIDNLREAMIFLVECSNFLKILIER